MSLRASKLTEGGGGEGGYPGGRCDVAIERSSNSSKECLKEVKGVGGGLEGSMEIPEIRLPLLSVDGDMGVMRVESVMEDLSTEYSERVSLGMPGELLCLLKFKDPALPGMRLQRCLRLSMRTVNQRHTQITSMMTITAERQMTRTMVVEVDSLSLAGFVVVGSEVVSVGGPDGRREGGREGVFKDTGHPNLPTTTEDLLLPV